MTFSNTFAIIALAVIGIIFLTILPFINTIFPIVVKGRPNTVLNGELDLDSKSREYIKRAVIGDKKIVLTRNGNVSKVKIDIIIHDGLLKPKTTYLVTFNDNNAIIDLKKTPKKIALIVLSCDGKVVNKKKYGYPNELLNIVTSLGIVLGVVVPPVVYGITNAAVLMDYYAMYGVVFYVVPIILGFVLGIIHYFGVKLISSSFNTGGKK